jgi:hypothetical protein
MSRAILLPLLALTSASSLPPSCGLTSPLLKVRPFDAPPSTQRSAPPAYALSLARNEYESFQIICVGPLSGVDVAVALPPALAGALPPPQLHSTLYYTNAEGNTSDCNAKQGAWPDPCPSPTPLSARRATARRPYPALRAAASGWIFLRRLAHRAEPLVAAP